MILSFNVLSDLIGPDWARLRALTTLDVSHNALATIPPEVGAARVKHLLLSHNNVQTIAASVFAIAAGSPTTLSQTLVVLDLSFNRLTALPASMAQLKVIRHLAG
jgi:Leucine-rich repeat (LRR) protein